MTKLQALVRPSDVIRTRLIALHDTQGMNWREIHARLLKEGINIPAGSLCTFAKDGTIARKYRTLVGLPAMIPAPVCSKCGVPHWYDCATQTVKAKNKPPVKRKRYPKYNNWLSDLPQTDVRQMLDERQEA